MTDPLENHIDALQKQVQSEQLQNQHNQFVNAVSQSSLYSGDQQNLIQWQLDLREDLERIEHLLKGDVIRRDKKGNEYYAAAKKSAHKPFNEYGVQLLLNIISFYLNRNTILSNYDEQTINEKMFDVGNDIRDLMFMKYEEMGMDTKEKRKLYPMIHRALVDIIHSAYLRAWKGGERDSLRTARHVTQMAPMPGSGLPNPTGSSTKFSMFKPTTWGLK